LPASLIVVPFFALFHLPARFVAGWIVDDHTPLAQVPTVALGYVVLAAVVAVFLRVLIMWVYNGSGRSVIVVGLFHSAFNITIGNEVMPQLLNLPASETSLMCLGCSWCSRWRSSCSPGVASPTRGDRPGRWE
jgi:hypothetical protein